MAALTIATRGSRLALWQAEHVKNRLMALEPGLDIELAVIKTRGDIILDVPLAQVGGKGLFVKEIEEALLDGRAALAVHSIKDVPDLKIVSLRGNVDTRLKKLENGEYDAIVLASAGIRRLELATPYMQPLPPDRFVPAVGQGALGIECRADDTATLDLLARLEHTPTRICVEAERGFLAGLDGGCQVPIGAHAEMTDDSHFTLEGLVGEVDGSRILRARRDGQAENARQTGLDLANSLLDQGARDILERLYCNR